MADFLPGIDVSHYNGDINWGRVAAGANAPAFVYLKATEGGRMIDNLYSSYRAGARAQGLLCGAYHFFSPTVPVAEQVANFCNTVGSVQGELPPMLDVEQHGLSRPDYVAAVAQWLQQVGDRLGCRPGIYTHPHFWEIELGPFTPFLAHPLWIAHYSASPYPALPAGAYNYAFWQYADRAVIDGIAGPVGMNRYAGSLTQLQALLCR